MNGKIVKKHPNTHFKALPPTPQKTSYGESDKGIDDIFLVFPRDQWQLLKPPTSSSTIYKVKKSSGDVFVLKYINPKIVRYSSVEKRYKEFDIANRIDHPNLVKYVACWSCRSLIYYQIEYCELGSLDLFQSESILDNNRKEKPEVWDIALDILLGLDCLHQLGFVHMDIKPSNIFLYWKNGRRTVKIGDFGTLTAINTDIKEEGDGLYVAPEVLSGKILTDPRFDIYILQE
jgi:mitosis inhibitor protein kinase SWE1